MAESLLETQRWLTKKQCVFVCSLVATLPRCHIIHYLIHLGHFRKVVMIHMKRANVTYQWFAYNANISLWPLGCLMPFCVLCKVLWMSLLKALASAVIYPSVFTSDKENKLPHFPHSFHSKTGGGNITSGVAIMFHHESFSHITGTKCNFYAVFFLIKCKCIALINWFCEK